jgi:hypothetical protein
MNRNKLMIKMRALLVAVATVCVYAFGLISCTEEDNSKAVHDPSKPVVLTSFTPDSGRIRERVLLNGGNFGTDASKIKVFFNSKEAKVINSTGTRILALVPRLPGDTCEISVEVDGKKVSYPGFFRYKIEASVTTIAGIYNVSSPVILSGPMEKCQFVPLYMGIDHEYNIFLGVDDNILKFDLTENECTPVASGTAFQRAQMNATPDNVIMVGAEGTGNRDFFYAMDPKEGWIVKPRYIKKWDMNGFLLPGTNPGYPYSTAGEQNIETHHHCLWCYADDHFYTRYNDGHIVKINPVTWEAKIIYRTAPGTAYGMAFHPIRQTELWLIYEQGFGGALSNVLCSFDVSDTTSFKQLSRGGDGGHRDGPLANALFSKVRQINFDYEGNLYMGDNGNHCVRKVDTETMMVETVIGIPGLAGYQDGAKEDALFNNLHGIVTDAEGIIYVSDHGNKVVRRIAIE